MGASRIEVKLLAEHFDIRTVLLEGGGHINGAFLEADLNYELSLLVVARHRRSPHIPAVFDGVNRIRAKAVPLKLKSAQERENGVLWIRYDVVRAAE